MNSQKGLTLIECVIAMVITLVGAMAIFQLIAFSVRVQQFAERSTEATLVAANRLETLKIATLTNGGSLSSDLANFSDSSNSNYSVRWTIADGSAGVGTKHVVIEVRPRINRTQNAAVRLETLIR